MSPLKLSPAHSTGQPHNTQFTSFSFRLRAKCDIYRGFHTRYTRNWSDAQSLRRTVFADCYFSILCHRSASKYFDTFSEQQTQFTEFSRMPLLEVCVDSFESAEAAIRGGAHRLELCSALSEGGLTPTVGLLKTIRSKFPAIKIFAMLRPTNRIDYTVTAAEMETILFDMQLFRENHVDGFVFGALKRNSWSTGPIPFHHDIDVENCESVIWNAHGLPVTFHRAIDMTDPAKMFDNLNVIHRCGFDRVLSSGFAETADKGVEKLIEMQSFGEGRYIIMPGCGITVDNADDILGRIYWPEFHASAKVKRVPETIVSYENDYQQKCLADNPFYVTSEEIVRKLVASGNRWDFTVPRN